MQALQKKVEDAEKQYESAKHGWEFMVRTGYGGRSRSIAKGRLDEARQTLEEARNNLNAATESQPQLIKRMEDELTKAKAVLAKTPPNSAKFDEAEKNVAIAEYRLAQASKPAPAAAAAFGGKSRRRRIRKVKQTQRRKAKRSSSYSA